MNRNQGKNTADEKKRKDHEIADKVTDDKRMNKKGRSEKHGRNHNTVLGEINDD